MSGDILATRRGAVQALAFNRPARRNAITAAMYATLADHIAAAEADDAVRVLLFHGLPEVFTSGNDIEDFAERPPLGDDTPVFRFLRGMSEARKPIVACVTGNAVGIGTTMLLHCEIAVAGDNARFALPFAQLGLVPEFASTYLLPLVAGYQRAAELLLLGETFDAARALEAGLVGRIVPADRALDEAWAVAERLAALPARSVLLTKALLKASHAEAIRRQLSLEGEHFRTLLTEPAARAALAAFLARRRT
ncbi:MAG TPA: enoyl-CoA hydratase-related protein [Usitatibacter sp.]|nr:enoyl-CoA hydratase-related protein [Usitatibacter sp.]